MSKFFEGSIIEYEKINEIKSQTKDPSLRASQIQLVKSILSNSEDAFQSSDKIIFSICSTMIGPNVILLPLEFYQAGIAGSAVSALIIGILAYLTCRLTYIHVKPNDSEYISTINRVMGKKWMTIYFLNSILITWLAAIIFYLTLADSIYSSICILLGQSCPDQGSIIFTELSYQTLGILLILLISWTFFLKKLGKIIKIASLGIYSVILTSIYDFYIGTKAILNNEVQFRVFSQAEDVNDKLALFTNRGIVFTIGVFAMSFTVHMIAVPILKRNITPQNNGRDLKIAYILTGVFYLASGMMGSMGIYFNKNANDANTVLSNVLYSPSDEFEKYLTVFMQFAAGFQMVTVLPILCFVIRNQTQILFWGEEKDPPRGYSLIFNIFFISTLLGIQIFNISPNSVMSLGGTICGLVILYIVPILLHWREIGPKRTDDLTAPISVESPKENTDSMFSSYLGYGIVLTIGVTIFILKILSLFSVIE